MADYKKIIAGISELNDSDALTLFFRAAANEKYFSQITRIIPYSDEPKFWQYVIRYTKKNETDDERIRTTGAMGWTSDRSLLKTFGEMFDRYGINYYDKNSLIYGSFKDLSKKRPCLDPFSVTSFSPNQRKTLPAKYHFDESSSFNWVPGYSLTDENEILIPAQLSYVPYFLENEPQIRNIISTGAACWSSPAGAIYQGICEVIERDSYMISILNRLPRNKVVFDRMENKGLHTVLSWMKKYNLDLHVFETTTDAGMYSFMALILDYSKVGPAVAVGIKAGLDPENVILGAIEEAQQCRAYAREKIDWGDLKYEEIIKKKEITLQGEKTVLWSRVERIKGLSFLLDHKNRIKLSKINNLSSADSRENLKKSLKLLKKAKLDVYFVDLNQPEVTKYHFFVFSTIIPLCQSFYINEPPAQWGAERLYTVPQILGYTKKNTREEDLWHEFQPYY